MSTTFPQFNRSYLIDVLKGNSMNIDKTYQFLADPIRNLKLLFNQADDSLILNMKDSQQAKNLERDKGIDRVREREDYLKGL
jgi:hypothetical protein